MASATLNVSLSKEQLAQVTREVDSGQYVSASEVVRHALREWLDRRIKADVAALEKEVCPSEPVAPAVPAVSDSNAPTPTIPSAPMPAALRRPPREMLVGPVAV